MEDNKVVQFELFKNQKKLDEEYPKFLGNCERTFNAKTDAESMFKRLYFTMRYLTGHINALQILFLLTRMKMEDQQRGIKYIIDWLEDILKDLKGIYKSYDKYK